MAVPTPQVPADKHNHKMHMGSRTGVCLHTHTCPHTLTEVGKATQQCVVHNRHPRGGDRTYTAAFHFLLYTLTKCFTQITYLLMFYFEITVHSHALVRNNTE